MSLFINYQYKQTPGILSACGSPWQLVGRCALNVVRDLIHLLPEAFNEQEQRHTEAPWHKHRCTNTLLWAVSSKAGNTLQLNRHGVSNGAQLILALPCNQALGNGPALLKVTAAHHGP